MPVFLTFTDRTGYLPDLDLIGTSWAHIKSRKVYVITNFLFHGEYDRWMVQYEDPMIYPDKTTPISRGFVYGVPFVRTAHNFFERFEEVKLERNEPTSKASS